MGGIISSRRDVLKGAGLAAILAAAGLPKSAAAFDVVEYEPVVDKGPKDPPVVLVFSGHTSIDRQAHKSSCKGVHETVYNDAVTERFARLGDPYATYVVIPSTANIPLTNVRSALADAIKADLCLEIHHDDVDSDKDISLVQKISDDDVRKYGGFSFHISTEKFYGTTLPLCRMIRENLKKSNPPMWPNYYHNQGPQRERIHYVKDWDNEAIYERNSLHLLKTSKVPTIIFECGVIRIPQEEQFLTRKDVRNNIVKGINAAIRGYYADNPPKRPRF